ncbi:hypothetical protein GGS20DRAFT_72855 [Poronia punctata]|nr:hypothetical protein GGS20DRAFT_72855 [Poronia punctata]
MGAKASKPGQQAAAAATRKFPTRAPGSAPTTIRQQTRRRQEKEQQQQQQQQQQQEKEASRPDGKDPDFDLDLNALTNPTYASRLQKMGVATPYPTYSPSSTAGSGPFTPPPPPPPATQNNNTNNIKPAPSTYTETSSSLNQPPSPSRSHIKPPPPPPRAQRNRTLNALEARESLQALAEAEFENASRGREFLDAATLRRALLLQKRGVDDKSIEERLGLKKGVVKRLGLKGVTVPVEAAMLNRQTWGGLSE